MATTPNAEIFVLQDEDESADYENSVLGRVEDLLTDHLFRMEARLYKLDEYLENQEELAQKRYSELHGRINVVEGAVMFASTKVSSATGNNTQESLDMVVPFSDGAINAIHTAEAVVPLERHNVRLGAAEVALQGVAEELECLKVELAAFQGKHLHQRSFDCLDIHENCNPEKSRSALQMLQKAAREQWNVAQDSPHSFTSSSTSPLAHTPRKSAPSVTAEIFKEGSVEARVFHMLLQSLWPKIFDIMKHVVEERFEPNPLGKSPSIVNAEFRSHTCNDHMIAGHLKCGELKVEDSTHNVRFTTWADWIYGRAA